jgi:hypothetical protein
VLDSLPYLLCAAAVICAWIVGLVMLDAFTTDDVRAWRRLSGLRGYTTLRSRLARRASRSRPLRRVQRELDLERMLAVTQRQATPLGFLVQSVAIALAAFSILMITDAIGLSLAGVWPLSPWVPSLLALALIPMSFVELRSAAARTRQRAGAALTDMTMMLAVLTDSRGFQLDNAARTLSRCSDPVLATLLDGGYRRLVAGEATTTVELYRRMAEAYGIPELRLLADAGAAGNTGVPERDVYTRLALALYQERLAGARVRTARARVLVTLPVAAMLIPLLLLIGAPTLSAISGGL